MLSVGDDPVKPVAEVADHLELEDRWILARVNHAVERTTRDLERFRLHEVAEELYHFFWGEVCDWYLELVKSRLDEGADPASREAARSTLVTVLDQAFRLLHPILPFITAELWEKLPWPVGTDEDQPADLIVATWPEPREDWKDPEAEALLSLLQETIQEVRRLRKEYGVDEGAEVEIVVDSSDAAFASMLQSQGPALRHLARVASVGFGGADGIGAHSVLSNGAELVLPLEGVIDLGRERERLGEEIDKLEGQLAGTRGRLNNEQFVTKAPDEIVQKERDKAAALEEQVEKLQNKVVLLGGTS